MASRFLVTDPNAPSGRGSVLYDIRNKNNLENLKLQRKIQAYDKELILMVKAVDFEKLDLCEFLKNLKNCDSDKLSQFKEIQDEIHRTQANGSPISVDLAQALMQSMSNMNIDGHELGLPHVLNQSHSISIGSTSPTKSTKWDKLPDLTNGSKVRELPYRSSKREKTATYRGARVAWGAPSAHNNNPSQLKTEKGNKPGQHVHAPFCAAPRPPSAGTRPKSIVQRKRRTGATGAVNMAQLQTKTIYFEETAAKAVSPENIGNLDHSEGPTENEAGHPGVEEQNKKKKENHQHSAKSIRLLNARPSLDSNMLLTKTATAFAQQARFYSEDNTDSLDLTLGLPLRSTANEALKKVDTLSSKEQKDIKATTPMPSPKAPATPVPPKAPLERQLTMYDIVVEMNKEKTMFSRQNRTVRTGTNLGVSHIRFRGTEDNIIGIDVYCTRMQYFKENNY